MSHALRRLPRPSAVVRDPRTARWLHSSCVRASASESSGGAANADGNAGASLGAHAVPDALAGARPAKFEDGRAGAGQGSRGAVPRALTDILERRKAAGRLVAGVAAASDSDMFKAPVRFLSSLSVGPSASGNPSHKRPVFDRPPGNLKLRDGTVSWIPS